MSARSDHRFTNRLVFLHGFTQTHHHWHGAAHAIGQHLGTFPTLAYVDLPGHGLAAADRLSIADAGARLSTLAGPGTYIGYSMGGRFALGAALERPDVVERLVLIGATAGIDSDTDRALRRRDDADRAAQIGRDGVDQFLDAWLAVPMFANLPADPADLEHRRRNTATGLADSLRASGTGSQPSWWPRLTELTMPVLVIAGDRDTKFTGIGRRMAELIPDATFHGVGDAGHAVHAEQPGAVAAAIATWLGQPTARPRANSNP